jgi:hypothetical protein
LLDQDRILLAQDPAQWAANLGQDDNLAAAVVFCCYGMDKRTIINQEVNKWIT